MLHYSVSRCDSIIRLVEKGNLSKFVEPPYIWVCTYTAWLLIFTGTNSHETGQKPGFWNFGNLNFRIPHY